MNVFGDNDEIHFHLRSFYEVINSKKTLNAADCKRARYRFESSKKFLLADMVSFYCGVLHTILPMHARLWILSADGNRERERDRERERSLVYLTVKAKKGLTQCRWDGLCLYSTEAPRPAR